MLTIFDKPLDEDIANLQEGLAIIANGNTHASISSGQFVYVRNHATLPDGLYKATSTIGANAALTTSNLADTSGALNDVQAQITTLNNNVGTVPSGQTVEGQITALNSKITNSLKSGENFIWNIIASGYNTGSGNYFDFFVPCSTGGKTVTSASIADGSIVYLPTNVASFPSTPEVTVIGKTDYGVRLEVKYPSTNTPNVCGTIYAINVKLTCS